LIFQEKEWLFEASVSLGLPTAWRVDKTQAFEGWTNIEVRFSVLCTRIEGVLASYIKSAKPLEREGKKKRIFPIHRKQAF